ncbi:MAG: nucleotidyltransferase family protein [Elusimicrobia bacterium]|nr:nucleotidyltransferase family protein [Elusimicrobiota bacterium]
MHTDFSFIGIDKSSSLFEVIAQLDKNRLGIVLVVDSHRRLLGTITDGDIRRAMLGGVSLDSSADLLLSNKTDPRYARPITAAIATDEKALLGLMKEYRIDQIPILDETDRVVGLVTLDELVLSDNRLPLQAVVMAGGYGARLRPLTEDLPKPMLPIDGRPLMEITVNRLRESSVKQIHVITHYKSNKIKEYFRDGSSFGVEMNYLHEEDPRGTAGSLSLMADSKDPLLVINGDIVTTLNFKAMLFYHQKQEADMTVAVTPYLLQVPFGVIKSDETSQVISVQEKPEMRFLVNAGIYLVEPSVCANIPNGRRFDMTDLIEHLMREGRRVVSFPIHEYWTDVGQFADYERVQSDIKSGKVVGIS